ncbi:hypothetical protein GCM10009091_00890 [Pseudomonas brenneri]|nr:hypothetical protein GCM10009091_00890 [Pseudomonas brenneri]
MQLAVDQVVALLDGGGEAKLFGNVIGGGKQIGKQVIGGHVATPGVVAQLGSEIPPSEGSVARLTRISLRTVGLCRVNYAAFLKEFI